VALSRRSAESRRDLLIGHFGKLAESMLQIEHWLRNHQFKRKDSGHRRRKFRLRWRRVKKKQRWTKESSPMQWLPRSNRWLFSLGIGQSSSSPPNRGTGEEPNRAERGFSVDLAINYALPRRLLTPLFREIRVHCSPAASNRLMPFDQFDRPNGCLSAGWPRNRVVGR
jgi:hypothetical protein